MKPILLQVTSAIDTLNRVASTVPAIPVQPVPPVPEPMTVMEILIKGGLIMIPIGILSVVVIYIFIERYFTIRRHASMDENFMNSIREYIRDGKTDSALTLCKNTQKPIARMIEKGISRIGKPIKEIEESIEIAGKFEVYSMEKNIQILAIIAGIAPMFGFLGTIIGVIKIFYDISVTSDVSIGSVSAGLYVKMVTSAAGLVVGIVAFIAYNWLNIMVNKVVQKLEWNVMNFIDLLNEPSK
jgi:biopolymer transport protein ExbB